MPQATSESTSWRNHDLFTGVDGTGSKFGVARIGAGRADFKDASESEIIVFADDDTGGITTTPSGPTIRFFRRRIPRRLR